jgi:excisionase family DNA binding protein
VSGYLSVKALAVYSGLSVRTLRAYLVHPSLPLPHYRVGGKILVRQSEFDGWMSRFRVSVTPRIDAVVTDILKGL